MQMDDGLGIEHMALDLPLPLAWFLGVSVLAFALFIFLYVWDVGRGRLRSLWIPFVLRLLALLVFVIVVCAPVLENVTRREDPSSVAVLIDTSASMSRQDAVSDGKVSRLERVQELLKPESGLVEDLAGSHSLTFYQFSNALQEIPEPVAENLARLRADGRQTALGEVLKAVTKQEEGEPLAGVLLFTDGGWNVGTEPTAAATALGRLGTPVTAIAIGSSETQRDVILDSVLAEEQILPGDKVHASVKASAHQFTGESLVFRILHEHRMVAQMEAPVGLDGQAEAHFSFLPETPSGRPGVLRYLARVAPREGEIDTANNEQPFTVELSDEPLRVLLIDYLSRWEFRFLKNLFARDEAVEVLCHLIRHSGRAAVGKSYLGALPETAQEMRLFDVVVFGDLNPEFLSSRQIQTLVDYVQVEGGALLFLAGPKFYLHEFRGSRLADLLPVYLNEDAKEAELRIFSDRFVPALTAAGMRHPAMRILGDDQDNARLWQNLPPFSWCARVGGEKPGATLLAVHPYLTTDSRPLPLFAYQRYGRGRVAYLGTDQTWRWRFGYGDELHHRFWGGLVRWLTENRFHAGGPRVWLRMDRTEILLGERVRVEAQVFDPGGYPLEQRAVQVLVVDAAGEIEGLPLQAVPDRRGFYEGEYRPPASGEFTLTLYAAALKDLQDEKEELRLTVNEPRMEHLETQLNENLLRTIAEKSGGAFHLPSDANSVPTEIGPRKHERVKVTRVSLWDTPWTLGLLLTLFGVEWCIRRRRGLA